ncbi:filamentous hemagglutinin family protein [Janthinobacterium fluminis]|uniref:Filamentous hemagglutinin family protein n=1 Tax=Janthinobacterium fluminis TaxID=2987524 RepID=A0ABT5JUK9_9BURK|nr:filamentous hemagglutinin family protein [Janthinobacterium fluminis]MDC8756443.1 filamentous hemagglutinin family protein [Janthinobacterium fluminis]
MTRLPIRPRPRTAPAPVPTPLAAAVATLMLLGGVAAPVQAQQAFSAAWFAAKGGVQQAAAASGRLPNGQPLAPAAPLPGQPRAGEQAERAVNNLHLAARAIVAQQAAQAAARQLALNGPSGIPDGLAEGGLKVDSNSLSAGWLNAKAPVQTTAGGKTEVSIEQTAEKAILNWERFNVGRDTTLRFDQRGGAKAGGGNSWIALNRINDPSGKPSQIAGQIKADGAVYLINRNGIIFTGSSQINTATLVASSLSLSDKQFQRGINNPNVVPFAGGSSPVIPQFGDFTARVPDVFGDSGFKPGSGGAPDGMGRVERFVPGAAPGEVRTEAGARLETAAGGKLMLFAPKVRNAGYLAAPDGQVILAAGENVYLKTSPLNDANGVRGLDVAVSATPGWMFSSDHVAGALGLVPVYADAAYVAGVRDVVLPEMAARALAIGYEVDNSGTVRAERGNITLQGRDVRQNGALLSTTALNNRSGSILMRAWGLGTHAVSGETDELQNWLAGTLTLGRGSVTQILPDAADRSEIEASSLATRYQAGAVGLYGQLIDFKPTAGVLVPAGRINVESAVNPLFTQVPWYKPGSLGDASRVYVDSDAFLSVAGLRDVQLAMARNFIEADLRINELRDSPLQRDSWLRGQKVVVDRRAGGVFDGGPMAGVQWLLQADGKYAAGRWAGTPLADVSGWIGVGKTDLQELSTNAGKITLRAGGAVITRAGSQLDVSGGSVRYADGLNTSTKLLGADGRVVGIDQAMPDLAYVGIAGRHVERHARWGVAQTWRNPLIGGDRLEAGYTEGRKAGAVQIFSGQALVLEGDFWGGAVVGERQRQQPAQKQGGRLELGNGVRDDRPWAPGQVLISHDPQRLAAGFDAGSALGEAFFVLPRPETGQSRPAKRSYLSDAMLNRSGMGEVVINLSGDFVLEAGAALELAPGAAFTVTGGEGSMVDMAVNGSIRSAGGTIAFETINGRVAVGAGSRLDAGGQWLNVWRDGAAPAAWNAGGGAITLGAGTLAIAADAVLDVSGGGRVERSGAGKARLRAGDAGSISLAGLGAGTRLGQLDLRGHAAGSAGRLVLESAVSVQIGGRGAAPGVLSLPATLFGERGFGDVTVKLSGAGTIGVPDDALVQQLPASVDLAAVDYRAIASGERLAGHAPTAVLAADARLARRPASLTLSAPGGAIDIGAGARVETDTGGRLSLNLSAPGTLTVRGTLEAPAGRIELSTPGALLLDADAQLLARGAPVLAADASGRLGGKVLAGGEVLLKGAQSLRLEAGAIVDVSGAYGEVDMADGDGRPGTLVPRRVGLASDGGSVTLQGGASGSMHVAATLRGYAGGAGAAGGRLTVSDISAGAAGGAGGVAFPSKLYWRDPVSGQVKSERPTKILDLDLFNEYGSAAMPLSSELRYALMGLPASAATGMEIVADLDGASGAALLKPWEVDASIDPVAVQLLLKNFWTDAALSKRLAIADIRALPSSRILERSLSGGGFGTLTLQADKGITLGSGVHVRALGELNIATARLSNGGSGGSARLTAPHLTLQQPVYAPTPWGAAAALGGTLTLAAQVIDVQRGGDEPGAGRRGTRIGGFDRTVLDAGSIRLGGALPAQLGLGSQFQVNLDVDGQLLLRAGQVSPDTAMTAVLRAGRAIVVEGCGAAAAAPLSAGGTLRLEAPHIEQGGVLRAPFGRIELLAGERLVLGAGSLTSVSGAGLAVPYGSLGNNEHWLDPTRPIDGANPAGTALAALPEKRITLKAPDVALGAGAVVDIAGGGDLHAAEFVPGPGGSHDLLATPGMQAILPGAGLAPAGGAPAGARVWLAGGPGLAAGWYTLLPACYALLPGAFAVYSSGKSWAGAAAGAVAGADGSLLMAGKGGNAYAGSQDAVATAWRVMPGKTLRRYTQYNEAFANDFFGSESFKLSQYRLNGQSSVTPRLARDGGAVVFDAAQNLLLNGTLRSQAGAGGRGGLVDIAGQRIAIVGAGQDAGTLRADGYLLIDAASLTNFGAGSLLVGGTRKGDPRGLQLSVTASDIVVRNGAGSALSGAEIILAASEKIAIEAGSVVKAQGGAAGGAGDLVVAPQRAAVYDTRDTPEQDDDVLVAPARDWGALLRVANGDAVKVIRQNVDSAGGGVVNIGAGAVVDGGAALLIDATRTTELAASARLSAASLSVAAGRIGFGGGSGGLLLDTATLAQLADAKHLTLRSYSSFDFYRPLDLGAAGLASVTFDGGAFVGHGAGDIRVKGATIALENSAGPVAAGGAGAGRLTLDADTLVLGAGQKRFAGFDAVELGGRARIVGRGAGGIDAGAAALTLTTPLLTGQGSAAQSIVTQGLLQVKAAAGAAPAERDLQDSLGARLSLSGASVLFGGRAVALGGSVELSATAGGVLLGEGAQIDVGGFARQFFDAAAYADAGRISLTAAGGDVRLDGGSKLNLAAHRDGGSAGTLALAATGGGSVVLNGSIAAQAGSGGKAGAFALDIDALPDFAGLGQRLNAAGFSRSRQFRIHRGDVLLDGAIEVQDFGLTADRGHVTVTGKVDARSAYGGSIRITGGNGVAMRDGAQLLAGANGERGLGGGRVTLEAAGGRLDVQGGVVDVAGGDGGSVRLRAARNGDADIAVDRLNLRVLGARSAVLEGVRVYTSASVDAVKADAVRDAGAFMGNAGAMAARLGNSLAIMPGIVIQSDADLAMAGDWNLFSDFAGAREGSLSLRAGGNLRLGGHLSDGFNSAGRDGVLQDAASWNLRLVAGADMGSAQVLALKPLAAQAGGGAIVVGGAGAGTLVRTGTGDIEVRAGRDLTLAHKESVIYTAGRKDLSQWSDFTTARADAVYGAGGGNLDIAAQGSIEAQVSGQRFTQWLNRQGNVNGEFYFGAYTRRGEPAGPEQSSWWINPGAFQQGVAALGGGNVTVTAGGDLGNLVVALPTTMRMRGGRAADEAMTMELRNGGAMTVEAGGAIRGGQYYVARGEGSIRAGETRDGHAVSISTPLEGPHRFTVAPVLALGDATLSLRTAGDLRLQSVVDPLLVRYGDDGSGELASGDYGAYMSGYTGRSALTLASTGGDVVLVNQADFIFRDLYMSGAGEAENRLIGLGGNRYPARTHAVAMNGGLEIQGPMYVMPAASNDLQLLARRDVRFNSQNVEALKNLADYRTVNVPYAQVVMAHATPDMVPSAYAPAGGDGYQHRVFLNELLINEISPNLYVSPADNAYYQRVGNPRVLALAGDFQPSRIYAAQGSILGVDMRASESTWLRAGTDIRGMRIDARNLRASDTTLLEAGNDIVALSPVRGRHSAVADGSGSITVQGPGTLTLSAGRDVYADNLKIQTLGRQRYNEADNRPIAGTEVKGLPEQGAAITVMAGMNQAPSYAAFAGAYLDPARVAAMPDYLKSTAADGTVLPLYLLDRVETRPDGREKIVSRGLASYMKEIGGETLAPLEAWARFQALPAPAQQQFLRQVYLLELREAGRDQNEAGADGMPRNGGYNRGYAAIGSLFPGDKWKGNVAANTLMLRTMAGGDINVLTPGGGLQVAALGAAVPAGHGLVTLASGHINVFAKDDVVVNRSRILSFVPAASARGSDQIIWSSAGGIDAGRGAKTVRVPSAPELRTDFDGNTVVREQSDMSGSGIGTVGDGDVDLIAPRGTVNAGDAGVRVAGNLNIAALQVLNAGNIQVKGESKGVPVLAAVNVGALSNASAAAAQAGAAAQDELRRERAAARQALPSIFTVRVTGFGGEAAEGGADGPAKTGAGAEPPGYKPHSVIRVLGAGALPESARQQLTPAERGQLDL